MSRLLTVLLACLLAVLLPPATACADQIDEWNSLMEQVNALIDETSAGTTQDAELFGRVNSIDPTAKSAADALPLLADMEANLGEMKKSQESIITLLGQMARLDVREEDKTYARQQKEIAELNVESFALVFEIVEKYKLLYSKGGTLSQAQAKRLGQEITDLQGKYQEFYGRISEKVQASEQYRADNPGGEASSSGGMNTAAWVGSLLLASAFSLACALIARRKNRNVVAWAIVGFLLPIISLVVLLASRKNTPEQALEDAALRHRLPPAPAPAGPTGSTPSPAPPADAGAACQGCGQPALAGDKYCRGCGSTLA